jgi:hypothetical protein
MVNGRRRGVMVQEGQDDLKALAEVSISVMPL